MGYSFGGFAFSSTLRAQASPSCKSFAFSASLTRKVCFSVRPAPEPAGRPRGRFGCSSMPAFYARQKVLAKSYLMSDTKCTETQPENSMQVITATRTEQGTVYSLDNGEALLMKEQRVPSGKLDISPVYLFANGRTYSARTGRFADTTIRPAMAAVRRYEAKA